MLKINFKELISEVIDSLPYTITGEFINTKTPVSIETVFGTCLLLPKNIINGKIPTINNAVDKNDYFIQNSKFVHGDKYVYDRVDYINSEIPVLLFCKKHNFYFETYSCAHLGKRKCGCPKCGSEQASVTRISISESKFESKIIKKYKDKNITLISGYTGHNEYVRVLTKYGICKVEATTLLTTNWKPNILAAVNKTEYWVNQMIEKYGDKYDYSLVNYITTNTEIQIICNEHGLFKTTPNLHLRCCNCSDCVSNTLGWEDSKWEVKGLASVHFDSFKIYIIRCWNDTEEFFKVGKTYTTTKRRFKCTREMPYNYEIIKEVINTSGVFISKLEREYHNKLYNFKYTPLIKFGGSTSECFSSINNLINLL